MNQVTVNYDGKSSKDQATVRPFKPSVTKLSTGEGKVSLRQEDGSVKEFTYYPNADCFFTPTPIDGGVKLTADTMPMQKNPVTEEPTVFYPYYRTSYYLVLKDPESAGG